MCDGDFTGRSHPYNYDEVERIAKFLKSKTVIRPRIGIIAGTGLGTVATLMTQTAVLDYSEIPGFPVSTVPGHAGKLHFGYISSIPTVCMQGRFHFYEGYPLWKCVLPVRVMKLLGISILLVSNAAGGINPNFALGDLMLIYDHLNVVSVAGFNPLRGPNEGKFGPRFVAINDAYDKELLQMAKDAAKSIKMGVQEGVYAYVGGPTFETVAELRALKMLGADAVGMSTVHEVITARHCGIKCIAFSLITNKCPLDYHTEGPNHEGVLNVAQCREEFVNNFVQELFKSFSENKVVECETEEKLFVTTIK